MRPFDRLVALVAPDRRPMLVQLLRFAVAGGLITLAFAACYWVLATPVGLDPLLANTLAFLLFTPLSYATHGGFSFAGHGGRDRAHARMMRFLAVNVVGYLVNQGWVWLLVDRLDGPTWWPTVPMVAVTPLLTFALHRRFVYA